MDPTTAVCLLLQKIRQSTEATALGKLYPDDGPLAREHYVKYIQMFEAGLEHNERAALGGNRVGKTLGIGGYETALHLTGLYPDWWPGYKFNRPITAWAAGTKAIKVRDVNQKMLLGSLHKMRGYTQAHGGLVPARMVGRLSRKSGVGDAVDQAIIKHVNGWENVLTFKSYEEGRTSFEAEGIEWIWLDEECSKPIYNECKMRILTTAGRILSTFTPVEGLTETVLSLLEGSDLMGPAFQQPEPAQ